MNQECPVLMCNDQRMGMRAHFKDIGAIGVVTGVILHTDGSEEFLIDLGDFCRLRACATHFELVKN